MAKLTSITYDDTGRATVTQTEMSPAPERSSSPKKRVPSSPHKPFTSVNFYDRTKSSPDVSPVGVKEAAFALPDHSPTTSSGLRVSQQMNRENIIPGPFANTDTWKPNKNVAESQGFRNGITLIMKERE
jgi:hypothetical protein